MLLVSCSLFESLGNNRIIKGLMCWAFKQARLRARGLIFMRSVHVKVGNCCRHELTYCRERAKANSDRCTQQVTVQDEPTHSSLPQRPSCPYSTWWACGTSESGPCVEELTSSAGPGEVEKSTWQSPKPLSVLFCNLRFEFWGILGAPPYFGTYPKP